MTNGLATRLRRYRFLCVILTLHLLSFAVPCAISFGDSSESSSSAFKPQQIKAAYLYKFLLLAEWPRSTAASEDDSLTLIIVDPNSKMDRTLFDPITQTSLGKSSPTAKQVTVQWVDRLPDNIALGGTHMIFWASPTSDIDLELDRLRDLSILTVCDSAGFLEKGGMIELRYDHGSIVFTINKSRIDRAGLWFPSTVYRLANSVLTKTGQ